MKYIMSLFALLIAVALNAQSINSNLKNREKSNIKVALPNRFKAIPPNDEFYLTGKSYEQIISVIGYPDFEGREYGSLYLIYSFDYPKLKNKPPKDYWDSSKAKTSRMIVSFDEQEKCRSYSYILAE